MINRVLQFSKRSYLENEMINVFQDICCIQQTSMISIASQIYYYIYEPCQGLTFMVMYIPFQKCFICGL